MKAIIITIGDELLKGNTIDSNAHWLAKQLFSRNIEVMSLITIGDNKKSIIDTISKNMKVNYDLIIITGGLGPTHDDITRNSLASLFNSPIIFLEERHNMLIEKYKKVSKKIKLDPSQSQILEISKPIENNLGLALGMHVNYKNSDIFILPGVPQEMKDMALSFLDSFSTIQTRKHFTISTLGIYENKLSKSLDDIMVAYKDEFYFSFLPDYTGVRLRVEQVNFNKNRLMKLKNILLDRLKVYAFSEKDEKLEKVISKILINKKYNLSIAESCTGGIISKTFTDIPGASSFYLGSIIAYSNYIKASQLNVDQNLLTKYGAVSAEVAEVMAKNISKKFHTDISISTTGISGPSGGSKNKPIGLVYISIYCLGHMITKKFIFPYNREIHRVMTKQAALYLLWRLLIDENKRSLHKIDLLDSKE